MNRNFIDQLFERYGELGHRHYGEEVTELEHAIQTALLAQNRGEGPSLIAAALLHDCGHLFHDYGEGIANDGVDAVHESIGADLLATHFPPSVSEPVRLHVVAKRYLCWARPDYYSELSAASRLSLALQGGPMTETEASSFKKNPFFRPALRLRSYDDAAKVAGLAIPTLESYRQLLTALLIDRSTQWRESGVGKSGL